MSAPVGVVMRRAAALEASRRTRPRLHLVPASPERALDLVLPEPTCKPSRCTYCGRDISRKALACHAHSDLPKVDPFFSPDVPQRAEPAERSIPEALPDRLVTKGQ